VSKDEQYKELKHQTKKTYKRNKHHNYKKEYLMQRVGEDRQKLKSKEKPGQFASSHHHN